MGHDFDADYWQAHWRETGEGDDVRLIPASPYLETELDELRPGTALDAGCGEGAEAIELASRGWRVTGADISAEALQRAQARAEGAGAELTWLEADLGRWQPEAPFDLVTTFYAHPDIPQLDFYARIAEWVAPGGTLLIVGHLRGGGHAHDGGHGQDGGHAHGGGLAHGGGHAHGGDHAHEPEHPVEATVRASDVAALLDPERWSVVTAEERRREIPDREGRPRLLHDVVVRATRH
ncbi:Methyltransferase domain-containing protein [Agrococcus baldri]|uniref:Methyltransferase domain-containing protein n=1 Tax=Agrococcus baldri TaxID=153730 RepID=A0AA94KZG1_9MICO|nr:class I SAM-dependent methyltransferase [Agrococcus baldri]SFS09947.1 Methyltransferase domain-containing protein [Agrococcus baldri]